MYELKDWIKDNKYHFDNFNIMYYTDKDTNEYTAVIGSITYVNTQFKIHHELFKDDHEKFKKYMSDFVSKIEIDDIRLEEYLALYIVKNHPEIQKAILHQHNSYEKPDKIVIVDSLKLLLEITRPYLDRIHGGLKVIDNAVKLTWNRGRNTLASMTAISWFATSSLLLTIDGRKFRAPVFRSKRIKNEVSIVESAGMVIKTHTDCICTFLNTVLNIGSRKYISELMEYKSGLMNNDMGVPGYDKMITVMHAIPVFDMKQYIDLYIYDRAYVEPEESSKISSMISKIKSLNMKSLENFTVTTNGVQFKVTNLSNTRTKKRKYTSAFRFQVNVPFLNWNIKDVVDLELNHYDIVEAAYRFYKSLELVGDRKQFIDKLQMISLGKM